MANMLRSNTTVTNNNQEFTQAEVWVNIGYYSEEEFETSTGEVVSDVVFISLVKGIPLDTLEDANESMTNSFLSALNAGKNGLKYDLLCKSEELAPGESIDLLEQPLGQLTIQLLRRKKKEEGKSIKRFGKSMTF